MPEGVNAQDLMFHEILLRSFMEQGKKRITELSDKQVVAVVFWLETLMLTTTIDAGRVDDALDGAKLRGGAESLGFAVAELTNLLTERKAAEKAREKEGAVSDE